MKHIFILAFLALSLTLQSQTIVTLDSIVYAEQTNPEDIYTTAFEYNTDGLVSKVINLDGDEVDFNITYNYDFSFNTWTIIQEGVDDVPLNFIYDTDNQLDSLKAVLIEDGYVSELLYDITSENNRITRSTYTNIYGGYAFLDEDKLFTYTAEGFLDSIIYLDVFSYGEETIAEVEDFTFVDGKVLSRINSDIFYPTSSTKDTIGYFANEKIAYFQRNAESGNGEITLKVEYEDSFIEIDDAFSAPFNFYEFNYKIFDDEYTDIYFALLNGNAPTKSLIEDEFRTYDAIWHYTLLVNTEEQEIPATAISVSPNPTADLITVDIDTEISKIEVYSMTGDLVKTQESSELILDVQDLITGNYFIVIKGKNGHNHFSKFQKI